ncbi:MAG TPA: tautomerase family protein [Vicinamibacteria bacterium]|nr:tautomerase family protein [Vicinamibacteria bacterium]
MPFVRITLAAGRDDGLRARVGDAVHHALVSVANVPNDDLFQVVELLPPASLRVTPAYLGIDHSSDVAIVQVFLNAGRSVEVKKALYASIAEGVAAAAGLRREDVVVSLIEVAKENWSFGSGFMSYPP